MIANASHLLSFLLAMRVAYYSRLARFFSLVKGQTRHKSFNVNVRFGASSLSALLSPAVHRLRSKKRRRRRARVETNKNKKRAAHRYFECASV